MPRVEIKRYDDGSYHLLADGVVVAPHVDPNKLRIEWADDRPHVYVPLVAVNGFEVDLPDAVLHAKWESA